MIADIDARIRRHVAGIRQTFRGVLTLVKTAGAVQLVQVDGLAGEQLQDAELFQHYGLTSNPPPGTMAVVVPVGGKTSHGIVIATEHGSYRLKNLASGEVAIYTDEGDSIVLKRGRLIEVTTQTLRVNAPTLIEFNTQKVQVNSPLVSTTGQIQAALDITDKYGAGGKSMANMRTVYNSHTHHENDVHGDTNAPTQQV